MVRASLATRTYTLHFFIGSVLLLAHAQRKQLLRIQLRPLHNLTLFTVCCRQCFFVGTGIKALQCFSLPVWTSNMLLRYSLGFLLQLAACLFLALAQCPHWRGKFRDCTCGVRYRDEEVRCCNPETCEEPDMFSRNRTCSFRCQNGGKFDAINRECSCPPGFFGLCCERGE